MSKLSFMHTRQLGIHVRFRGRRLRIAMRLLLIPLLIAVLTITAAMFIAVVPYAATMATG